jgi:hypothetical protein
MLSSKDFSVIIMAQHLFKGTRNTMKAKITAQETQTQSRFVIKFDPKEMNWDKKDIIRVITNKKENKIILTRVANKYSKQIAHTITSTGRGDYEYNQGIFVGYNKRRFAGELAAGKSAEVRVRKLANSIEIKMPKAVFA